MRRRHGRRRDEAGSITVLSIGMFVVVGLLTVVVVNASAAFLQRQQLNGLADGAALAAADGLDQAAFYTGGTVELSAAEARRLAAEHVAASGEPVTSVRVTMTAGTVTVRLERRVDLAITPPGFASATTIVSESSTQLRAGD